MIIKVPMDEELYDAALKVLETLEEKLTRSGPRVADEEVLGRDTAEAFRRWQALVLSRYVSQDAQDDDAPDDVPAAPAAWPPSRPPFRLDAQPEIKTDGRRNNRPARPPGRNHPWRTKPKLKP